MKNVAIVALVLCLFAGSVSGQGLRLGKHRFELRNVKGEVVKMNGTDVLKITRDLEAIPFDEKNLGATVDEPTYALLQGVDFENGTIEVKMLSRIQQPSPFGAAQGFIGLAFRIDATHTAFESIYLRPKVGRAENQSLRKHTVQYFAYPDHKFDRLRKEADGIYESAADIGLDEWITIRIEVAGKSARMYVNDAKEPVLTVETMKGKTLKGGIGLWVDIGTEGYFKDLKVSKR